MLKELKAKAYDLLATIEHSHKQLKEVNEQIQVLHNQTVTAQTAPQTTISLVEVPNENKNEETTPVSSN